LNDIGGLDDLKLPGWDKLFVYILQAHSLDWPVGSFSHVKQPTQIEERKALADKFVQDMGLKMPLVMDNMQNEFNFRYMSWPHKMYLIIDGRLVYKEPWSAGGLEMVSKSDKLIRFLQTEK
jgi:hypothetical protein